MYTTRKAQWSRVGPPWLRWSDSKQRVEDSTRCLLSLYARDEEAPQALRGQG
jgi:hypothetical protein